MKKSNFTIVSETKSNPPKGGLLFKRIKNAILGEGYKLNLVFASKNLSRKLNKQYRKIDEPTDILSFPLDENEGEIFISREIADTMARQFGREKTNFIFFLFIHGLLHLKGMKHGAKMESEEIKYRKIFGI